MERAGMFLHLIASLKLLLDPLLCMRRGHALSQLLVSGDLGAHLLKAALGSLRLLCLPLEHLQCASIPSKSAGGDILLK